ncbi:hypothetical protein C8R46DRAFT_1092891 [Mycena filopes]|nr:hypothetical protein C8R46DRAFT_1092891 [Mycena filopes]
MSPSSTSFSVSSEAAHVSELVLALHAAQRRIKHLEKIAASGTLENGANNQMVVVELAGQVMSDNYERLNAVMREQMSAMQSNFLELRRTKSIREQEESNVAALKERLAKEQAATANLKKENEQLKARCAQLEKNSPVSSSLDYHTKFDDLENRYVEMKYINSELTEKFNKLAFYQSHDDGLNQDTASLRSENLGLKQAHEMLSEEITKITEASSVLQSKYDALQKRCSILASSNGRMSKKIQESLATTKSVQPTANQSSKKRKNPPIAGEEEDEGPTEEEMRRRASTRH